MTHIVSVNGVTLEPWPRSHQALLLDTDIQSHFRVVTVVNPWRQSPFSMAFPVGAAGTLRSIPGWIEGAPRMVTGGEMDMVTVIGDLTHRLETQTLMSEAEGHATYLAMMDQDTEAFGQYTARRTPQIGT